MASLTVTYIVGAVASFILYYCTNKDANILQEYRKLNWAPFLLGLVIVGLEVGFIYAYKAGWPVSAAQIVQAKEEKHVSGNLLSIYTKFYGKSL